ncbi:MAG TPA: hypothetical protein VFJ85_09645 [Acidimicrobiales bacterium]|nr:hypothetical protein [Acidimicrobiales bacterium]
MRRLLALLALVAAAVGVPSARAAPADPLADVQKVLDARTAAVAGRDRAAFLATVDPKAPADFRKAQAQEFDGLVSLPLASFALKATTEDTGDLGVGLAGRYGGVRVFLPETRQIYRLAGYDDRDAVDHLWLTYVERDGHWYVAGDADLDALGYQTDKQLWDFGPVQLQRSEHVLVLSHPEQAQRAAALASLAEQAVAQLGGRWDQPWSGHVPMVLAGSVGELERLLESTVDLDKFVAFAAYGVERDDGWVTTAPRIYVQDARLSAYPPANQVETLVHELTHVAAASLSGPLMPAWVQEGVADWVATGRSTSERRPAGGDAVLPRDYEMSTGAQASIVRAYKESRSAISLLAARAGVGAPSAFLVRLGAAREAPGSVDHNVDEALKASSGMTLDQFQAAWAGRR